MIFSSPLGVGGGATSVLLGTLSSHRLTEVTSKVETSSSSESGKLDTNQLTQEDQNSDGSSSVITPNVTSGERRDVA
ncbi:hypothetical protein OVS_03620 [Mycoplasma ovis str. Michigan]|uniref:Secreted protein n=1 Tax=Mycoplasma ovis str. Michigan TaxID=1415773 RepID=A0ABN4BRK9_9MOLU|nr:hypothetical protein [Mycoplasma ovis]AHC40472.1 hypothetical protein OVS_03620 [Mycoplasma ovis str. Michigan]